MKGNWLLPESLADMLPAEARRIEDLRRHLLDLFRTYGFELVAPPLVEYIDSLLSGTGSDLNLRTSKLVDQLSGRTLGVRADMTPQVTRIDAHLLNRSGVTRLCYCGPVLHARPAGLLSSRELLQIGADIYGHAGVEADLEIIRLSLESTRLAGVQAVRLDLCHAGLVRSLLEGDPQAQVRADEIMALLREKDLPGLSMLDKGDLALQSSTVQALCALPQLYGDISVIARARQVLPASSGVTQSLDTLEQLLSSLDDVSVGVDLADVGTYGYHSGVTFSIYAEGWHDAIVQGGRYDDVSRAFGRARPATGFSLDLRKLAAGLLPALPAPAIRAPSGQDAGLRQAMQDLRQRGNIVVQVFPGEVATHDEFVFDRELVLRNGQWMVQQVL
ncbi:ATP phosphoribosyltransferase regulatory subunit [Zwartia vadi]|uniref:ATP phosphoribosyltransferase regulatory subunit n=1 Tax=Zwartia vadi TaxID=3058168 RepID=UPI0025B556BB|nr:ATP phosphoribosyltransferase regulatory subunit [Zwartia vadi]MDN3988432.1 ATP phosphoribosyltransferase regulatory subunit [Zwartia vadi]